MAKDELIRRFSLCVRQDTTLAAPSIYVGPTRIFGLDIPEGRGGACPSCAPTAAYIG